jgi:hypothetical protein
MSGSGAGHVQATGFVRARGRAYPVTIALAVLETLETTQKLNIQQIFGVGPIEYIYVWYMEKF